MPPAITFSTNPFALLRLLTTAPMSCHATNSPISAIKDPLIGRVTNVPKFPRLSSSARRGHATGLRLSEVVAATVDDMQWVEYPADASDDQAMQGWMLRVIGKGLKEREEPLPGDVVGELARYMVSRGA